LKERQLNPNEVQEILKKYKTVAVVGLSRDLGKDSHRVSAYLKNHGFSIIPLNPFADEVLSEKSYKSLLAIPSEIQKTIEVVDIFRPSKDVPLIVKQAIKLKAMYGKPHVVWMQLGIVNEQAAEAAEKAGLIVVMDKCMMIEHKRFF
jgi:predicted CoA-binding protein